jgi:hypothetical protein
MCFSRMIICILLLVLTSCHSEKRIPRHQTRLAENLARGQEVDVSPLTVDTNQFPEVVIRAIGLLQSDNESDWLLALDNIEAFLFEAPQHGRQYYTSSQFVGYLNAYARVNLKALDPSISPSFQLRYQQSLTQFRRLFLDPCIQSEQNQCEILQNSLRQEVAVVGVIVHVAQIEPNLLLRQRLLESAFDSMGRRRSQSLESLYLDTSLEILVQVEDGDYVLPQQQIQSNVLNLQFLIRQTDWAQSNTLNRQRFRRLEPWLFSKNSDQILNELRQSMITYLPIYSREDEFVRNKVREVNRELITAASVNAKDLSYYPAFADISLDSLSRFDSDAFFLAVSLYFQRISLDEANGFFANVQNRSRFVNDVFSISQILIRWDIAQLSVESTEQIHQRFSQEESLSSQFLQELMDWSRNLTPLWNEFHSVRLWTIKTWLEGHVNQDESLTEQNLQHFFGAINRNILKTTVYPNMLALSYHMARYEWSSELRILWFVIHIDTIKIMDYMINGQYQNPWFNFVNLSERQGRSAQSRMSLFRSEMFDAFYYFITTRTAEIYDIDPDSFIQIVGESLFKNRRSKYEDTLQIQNELYMPNNTPASLFVEWCSGLQSSRPKTENIPFYDIDSYITPMGRELFFSDFTRSQHTHYFGDFYNSDTLDMERLTTTNDRYRMEFLPIYTTLKHYLDISKRAKQEHPSLQLNEFDQTQQLLDQMDHLKLRYIGTQKHIATQMEDCLYLASKEARRRIKETTAAHYKYYSEIVYPLMQELRMGTISIEMANQTIKDFHNNQLGYEEFFTMTESGDPSYTITKLSFMLRTRMFLIEGRNFSMNSGQVVDIPAVVGRHLEIPIPSNFLESSANRFLYPNRPTPPSQGDSIRPSRPFLHFTAILLDHPHDFAQSIVVRTMDALSGLTQGQLFTAWDKDDASKYTTHAHLAIEFWTQLYQLGSHEYLDVTRQECLSDRPREVEGCVLSFEYSLDDLSDKMLKLLRVYQLDETDQEFFSLIDQQGWADGVALHSLLKIDTSVPYDLSQNSLPYSELAGFFDYIYTMLRSDYLGVSYLTEWDRYLSRNGGADRMGGNSSCEAQREGCHWKNERIRAREFFQARAKRPGIFFTFDQQILVEDYDYNKTLVRQKIDRLTYLEEQGPALVARLKENDPSLDEIYVNINKRPSRLVPLSPFNQNNQRLWQRFFSEETEGYYTDNPPNWQDYLYTGIRQ